jgi:hypothetical protein
MQLRGPAVNTPKGYVLAVLSPFRPPCRVPPKAIGETARQLKIAVEELAAARPAPVRANAIPLKTVEAGNGFADLEPLTKIVGNARRFFHVCIC